MSNLENADSPFLPDRQKEPAQGAGSRAFAELAVISEFYLPTARIRRVEPCVALDRIDDMRALDAPSCFANKY